MSPFRTSKMNIQHVHWALGYRSKAKTSKCVLCCKMYKEKLIVRRCRETGSACELAVHIVV